MGQIDLFKNYQYWRGILDSMSKNNSFKEKFPKAIIIDSGWLLLNIDRSDPFDVRRKLSGRRNKMYICFLK